MPLYFLTQAVGLQSKFKLIKLFKTLYYLVIQNTANKCNQKANVQLEY